MYNFPSSEFAKAFKAYDIRGQLGSQITESTAYWVGRGYACWYRRNVGDAKRVVVGSDARITSPSLKAALAQGLRDEGVDVYDIGLCGTEEIYHAAAFVEPEAGEQFDGGIMVTASHNPIDYNGLKLVREGARPISNADGLEEIKQQILDQNFDEISKDNRGAFYRTSFSQQYIDHLANYIDCDKLRPLRVVVNAGNGAVGPAIDEIENRLPIEMIKINHEPNGSFPNGIPNPMLLEQQEVTASAVREHNADLGIAWDGDFDRCFFFDENGDFIDGYYIVGVLAEAFLRKDKDANSASIVHDPRLIWNTQAICKDFGATAIQSVCGHSFIKKEMRDKDAVYGGEMSAHHYFRDFAYCDSGMIPWLLIVELVSDRNEPLSKVVGERVAAYACSGEINSKVSDADAAISAVESKYTELANSIDKIDGVSMDFGSWRFNLRKSNTEPLVRLNVESTSGMDEVKEQTDLLLAIINS